MYVLLYTPGRGLVGWDWFWIMIAALLDIGHWGAAPASPTNSPADEPQPHRSPGNANRSAALRLNELATPGPLRWPPSSSRCKCLIPLSWTASLSTWAAAGSWRWPPPSRDPAVLGQPAGREHDWHRRVAYGPRAGLCLKTQHIPDSPNRPGSPRRCCDPVRSNGQPPSTSSRSPANPRADVAVPEICQELRYA